MAYDVVSLLAQTPRGSGNSETQSRWPGYVNTGGKFSEYGNHQNDRRERQKGKVTKSEKQAMKMKH